MAIGRIGIIGAVGALSLLCSCAAQPSASGTNTASASAAAGGGASCEVDAKRVCQTFHDKPKVVDSQTGLVLSGPELEQAGSRTLSLSRIYQIPNGAVIEVDCDVNAVHNSVVYARTTKTPVLSGTDVEYLRANNLCKD